MSDGLDSVHLMELLCARLCHDLAGPVGAAATGAELFEDGLGDADGETLALVAASAASAATRLKFFRTAFGPATSSQQSTVAVRDLVSSYLKTQVSASLPGIVLQWDVDATHVTGQQARILLNLVLLGKEALPRGGLMVVELRAGLPGLVVQGEPASLNDDLRAALNGQSPSGGKAAQAAFLCQMLAAEQKMIRATIGQRGLVFAIESKKTANSVE